ncbi:FAD-binding, type 2 [Niveomyces insectorum RCEF 264]|uniref:Delta(24)-sterol reductase n=1 Tax=Niveomyces insectorum RCEF 264 TaxID=1081102 RepID=A0A167WEU1_9HYPO|nr:FAD-binding, type 2 [Niveomyces insectorum RCEF 264]
MRAHDVAVEAIAFQVRQFFAQKRPFRIYHGSTNSTRVSQRHRGSTVDTSSLNRVLRVDRVNNTALVEPNVPMDALVAATLEAGLVPLVVMEFPGITVGGGFSGTSGESSSFRHGAFDATINWIEIVLPNGEVTTASRTTNEKTDLFWGAASAFGTLGVVTLLEVQLREAKPYVRLTYSLHDHVAGANAAMRREIAREPVDYVDGIVLSRDATIVCSGRLADRLPDGTKPQRFMRSTDPWFFVHVRGLQKRLRAKPSATVTEFVPLVDYLFRYDRGGFWAAIYSFRYFLTPFNRVTRFVLDPLLHTRTMYRALHASGLGDAYLVQDVGVPCDKVAEFVDWLHETFHIYPLWLCPLRLSRTTSNARHGLHAAFADLDPASEASWLMNVGIWGPGSFDRREFVRQNRLLELKVQALGGKKWLYAQAYYSEAEFWAHYDRQSYDAVRAKYGAAWMPTVYDKVKVDLDAEARELRKWVPWLLALFWSIWPLKGLYGVAVALLGGDYLLRNANNPAPVLKKE